MTKQAEAILEKLETVTASLAGLFSSSGEEVLRLEASGPLLTERGELIAALARELEGDSCVSYVEFNRLVILHAQGSQIASSLLAMRSDLASLGQQADRQRAYANRLQGMIEPVATSHSEKA